MWARDQAPESEKLRKEQENNSGLYHTESTSSATSLRSNKLVAFREWRGVKYGEELFIDYTNYYEFT